MLLSDSTAEHGAVTSNPKLWERTRLKQPSVPLLCVIRTQTRPSVPLSQTDETTHLGQAVLGRSPLLALGQGLLLILFLLHHLPLQRL